MTSWTVKRGDQERYVSDIETLTLLAQQRRLRASDLVFHPELQQWLTASDVPELSNSFGQRTDDNAAAPSHASHQPSPAINAFIDESPSRETTLPVGGDDHVISLLLRYAGGVVSIVGGISLVLLRAASENNLFEAIANGIGIYCIGRGLFMLGAAGSGGALLEIMRRRVD